MQLAIRHKLTQKNAAVIIGSEFALMNCSQDFLMNSERKSVDCTDLTQADVDRMTDDKSINLRVYRFCLSVNNARLK
jgi:hypothetical protein